MEFGDGGVSRMWDVFQRELRELARQRSTYALRLLAGCVALGAVWWLMSAGGRMRVVTGGSVFAGINKFVLILLWIVAPLMTADCLAREKREGTLGLLFLTPLTATQCVLGKAWCHLLRGLVLIAAAFPVLMVPVLMGGVTWMDAIRMGLLQLATLALALAAGITASAHTTDWWRARALSLLLTFAAGAVFALVYIGLRVGWGVHQSGVSLSVSGFFRVWMRQLGAWVNRQAAIGMGDGWAWRRAGSGADALSVWMAAGTLLVCMCLAALAIAWAVRTLQRAWAAEVQGRPQPEWQRLFVTERFARDYLRVSRRRWLDRNPIDWYYGRHWQVRVWRWGSAGGMLMAVLFLVPGISPLIPTHWFMRVLAVGLAAWASAGFFRDRMSGALEMLLVSPLEPSRLLWGRAWGILKAWAPVWIVFIATAGYFDWKRGLTSPMNALVNVPWMVIAQYAGFLWAGLVLIPVGLWCSLRFRVYPVALGVTVFLTLGLRIAVLEFGQDWFIRAVASSNWTLPILLVMAMDVLVQGCIGTQAWILALKRLRGRLV